MTGKHIRFTKIINCSFIYSLLFFFQSCKNEPKNSKEQIKNAVSELIKKEQADNDRINYIQNLIKEIFKLFDSSDKIMRFVLILLIVTVLFVIIYFIIKYINSKKIKNIKNTSNNLYIDEIPDFFDVKVLNSFTEKKDYSQAIVYLHKMTILYLLTNKIIYKKNMTNYDCYNKINNEQIAKPFKFIYKISERILFDDYVAPESEYNLCYEQYKAMSLK